MILAFVFGLNAGETYRTVMDTPEQASAH